MDKLHYETEWMAICRGLPAYKVAQILNRYSPGTDWTRCGKRDMAEAWVAAHMPKERGYSGRITNPEALRKELEEAPRETPAARRKKKAKRSLEKRIAYLKSTMEVFDCVPYTTETVADALLKLKPAAQEVEMLLASWRGDISNIERRINGLQKELSYVVQLEMGAQRALRELKP